MPAGFWPLYGRRVGGLSAHLFDNLIHCRGRCGNGIGGDAGNFLTGLSREGRASRTCNRVQTGNGSLGLRIQRLGDCGCLRIVGFTNGGLLRADRDSLSIFQCNEGGGPGSGHAIEQVRVDR